MTRPRRFVSSRYAAASTVAAVLLAAWLPACLAGEKPSVLQPWKGLLDGVVGTDAAALEGKCAVADLSKPRGTLFAVATPTLAPGLYRAAARIKLSELGTLNTSPLLFHLYAEGACRGGRDFDILLVEKAGEYQEVVFTLRVPGEGKGREG